MRGHRGLALSPGRILGLRCRFEPATWADAMKALKALKAHGEGVRHEPALVPRGPEWNKVPYPPVLVSAVIRKAIVLCGAVLALAACQQSQPRSFASPPSHPSAPGQEVESPLTRPPRCGVISLTSKGYGSHIGRSRGHPGDRVEVFGSTFRGENGRFFPSDRLEIWWNTNVPTSEVADTQPIRPGPVVLLTVVSDMSRCRFRTSFEVPDVRPGGYKVVAFVFHEGGYGWFGSDRFRVTAKA